MQQKELNLAKNGELPVETYKEETPASWYECQTTDDQIHDR
jgi:hypothetical protein